MHTRWTAIISAFAAAFAVVAVLPGCSGSGDPVPFAACGNGRLDAGEQCDDGNLEDNDDCLSTCVLARCGDTFIDSLGTQREDCDGSNLGQFDCFTLGFGSSNNLRCNLNCRFDTSGCPPAPTPTPTVMMAATSTPTVTPTPLPVCHSVTVVVSLDYDTNRIPDLAGLVVDLTYPFAAVSIPGSGSDDAVIARVTDVSGAGGFASIVDQDTDSDGSDDRLHNAYVSSSGVPPGPFEEVVFDCAPGSAAPPNTSFICAVSDTNDSQGNPVEGVGCSITVTEQ